MRSSRSPEPSSRDDSLGLVQVGVGRRPPAAHQQVEREGLAEHVVLVELRRRGNAPPPAVGSERAPVEAVEEEQAGARACAGRPAGRPASTCRRRTPLAAARADPPATRVGSSRAGPVRRIGRDIESSRRGRRAPGRCRVRPGSLRASDDRRLRAPRRRARTAAAPPSTRRPRPESCDSPSTARRRARPASRTPPRLMASAAAGVPDRSAGARAAIASRVQPPRQRRRAARAAGRRAPDERAVGSPRGCDPPRRASARAPPAPAACGGRRALDSSCVIASRVVGPPVRATAVDGGNRRRGGGAAREQGDVRRPPVGAEPEHGGRHRQLHDRERGLQPARRSPAPRRRRSRAHGRGAGRRPDAGSGPARDAGLRRGAAPSAGGSGSTPARPAATRSRAGGAPSWRSAAPTRSASPTPSGPPARRVRSAATTQSTARAGWHGRASSIDTLPQRAPPPQLPQNPLPGSTTMRQASAASWSRSVSSQQGARDGGAPGRPHRRRRRAGRRSPPRARAATADCEGLGKRVTIDATPAAVQAEQRRASGLSSGDDQERRLTGRPDRPAAGRSSGAGRSAASRCRQHRRLDLEPMPEDSRSMARPSAERSAAAATSDQPSPVPRAGRGRRMPDAAGEQFHRLVEPGQRPGEALDGPGHAAASVRRGGLDQPSVHRPVPAATSGSPRVAPGTSSSAVEHPPEVRVAGRQDRGCRPRRSAPSSTTSTRSNVRVVADVVGDAEQRGIAPVLADEGQQRGRGGSVEPAERLVEDDEPDARAAERPAEPHALALAARDQRATLAERRLQAVGQLLDQRRCRLAAVTANPAARARRGGLPYRRFSSSDRFQSCTAGSTQAVSAPEPGGRSASSGSPSTSSPPAAAGASPSSRPTRSTFPAPDAPTIATCAPAGIARSTSREHGVPAARTPTRSMTMSTPPTGRPAAAAAGAAAGAGRSARAQRAARAAQHHVARCAGTAGRSERELLAERRDAQRPVEQQERRRRRRAREVRPQQPGRDGEAARRLQRLSIAPPRRAATARRWPPFAAARARARAARPLGAMGADRHQAEQRIEVVAGQRAGVGPHAQVELGQQRLRRERHRQRHRRPAAPRSGALRRIEPDDPTVVAGNSAHGAHEAARQRRHWRMQLQAVDPLRHIGDEPAVEVAIAEPRHLREEPQAERDVETPPDGQQPRRQRAARARGGARRRRAAPESRPAAARRRPDRARRRAAPRKSSASTTTAAAAMAAGRERTRAARRPDRPAAVERARVRDAAAALGQRRRHAPA